MTFTQYKKEFSQAAALAGYSEQNLQKCLQYSKVLIENKVPVIYNTRHLCSLVGYNKLYLHKAAFMPIYFYRSFTILKKNGSKRTISEPLPSLKEIQKWILEEILYNIKVSPYAKAYVPGTGLKQNLTYHKNQQKLLTVDIKDFFPSISLSAVEQIFLSQGYSKLISNLLAKLCCLDKCLPQGAPTSPYLSNLFFRDADNTISQYCKENDIRYTRYADDLYFSGDFDEMALKKIVFNTLKNLGLIINENKTKLMGPSTAQLVTGVVVNDKIQVPYKKRNIIRQEIYYIKRFGIEGHKNFKKIKQSNFYLHILGQINYVLYINPEDKEFLGYKEYLHSMKI